MVPMRKKLLVLYIIWFISGSLLALGSMYLTPYFLIPLFGTQVAIGILSLSIRCPECKQPVLKQKMKLFNFAFTYWGCLIPKKCHHCEVVLK